MEETITNNHSVKEVAPDSAAVPTTFITVQNQSASTHPTVIATDARVATDATDARVATDAAIAVNAGNVSNSNQQSGLSKSHADDDDVGDGAALQALINGEDPEELARRRRIESILGTKLIPTGVFSDAQIARSRQVKSNSQPVAASSQPPKTEPPEIPDKAQSIGPNLSVSYQPTAVSSLVVRENSGLILATFREC